MEKDTVSKSWFCVFNNPEKHGYDGTPEEIINKVIEIWVADNSQRTCAVAYCISADGLKHCHAVFEDTKAMRFSAVKKVFPSMNIQSTKGSKEQAEDYINKRGKWEEKDEKVIFVSRHGEIKGRQGARSDLEDIYLMLKHGATDETIAEHYPDHYMKMDTHIERIRQKLRAEEHREKWRTLEVTYIWGTTGTGKTRSVMEGHGYSNVYHVNDYSHPFDGYAGESVILFDEFKSSLRIQDMNHYLDGYPLSLPARYSNKQACYERAFIISNIDLFSQYENIQDEHTEIWQAFLRRIHKVVRFFPDGKRKEYTREEYMKRSVKELALKHARNKNKGGD